MRQVARRCVHSAVLQSLNFFSTSMLLEHLDLYFKPRQLFQFTYN